STFFQNFCCSSALQPFYSALQRLPLYCTHLSGQGASERKAFREFFEKKLQGRVETSHEETMVGGNTAECELCCGTRPDPDTAARRKYAARRKCGGHGNGGEQGLFYGSAFDRRRAGHDKDRREHARDEGAAAGEAGRHQGG